MLDDFREWLSDNLRYILLGLAVILAAVIIFCIVRLIGGRSSNNNSNNVQTTSQNNADDITVEDTTEGAVAAVQTTAAGSDLVKDDAAVLKLVTDYYTAAAAKDVGTLSKIVSPWDDSVSQSITGNNVIESYNNITTYSKDGVEKGSYVVYAYYEGKIADIDTLAPSLSVLYAVPGENGSLVISSDKDSDSEISSYINTVSADADVQALIADVNKKYQQAIDSDEALKNYLSTLNGNSGSDSSEGSTASGSTMQSTANLNIRESASTDANIMGVVSPGETVTVNSEADADGWVQITYESSTGTINGYVKAEYLTSAGE